MAGGIYKIGIVGAGTLLGKELSETMADSALGASEIVLLDEGEALGELTTAGDEVTFIQRLDQNAFERMDFVFFAGAPELTLLHWRKAVAAGALVIDLTGALDVEVGVPVMAPVVMQASSAPQLDADFQKLGFNLHTNAVVPAHPAATMLALLFAKLDALPLSNVAVTLLEPASQYGREAMDELHQQTVNLLSFQSLPREQYDAQIAFNVLAVAGEAASVAIKASEKRIRAHYARLNETSLDPGKLPQLALQLSHAPAFHGFVASILLGFSEPVGEAEIAAALASDRIEVVDEDADAPSNLSAAGQEGLLVRIHPEQDLTRCWLWVAADNLKLAALNAIACALEMRRLRPSRQVQ
jgi:aspartate-semialdehyde dehydrogenase